MNRNYMVLRPETGRGEEYAVRMLTENQIPGFLPFQEKQVDGERWFYYDITSRQPLERILEYRNMSGRELERLAADLLFSLRQAERYLLDEKAIALIPEMIYIDPDSFQCSFCLVPGRDWDFSQSFRDLSQYLLDHVSHKDGEAVILAFAIFRESRKENFGLEEIGKCLEKARRESGSGESGEKEEPGSHTGHRTGAAAEREKDPREADIEKMEWGTAEWEGEEKRGENPEKALKRPAEKSEEKERGLKLAVIVTGILMAALPAAAAALSGPRGLFQYKWILGTAELVLAAVGAVLLTVKGAGAGGRGEPAPSGFQEEIRPQEKGKEREEPWEVYFGEADEPETYAQAGNEKKREEENDFQTVLLTARPVEAEGRKLTAFSGNLEIPLAYYPFLIGKSREMADFCLNEPGVSRLHIKIEERDGAYTITDLNSTNGTRVNGLPLGANETRGLEIGSEVEIAGKKFRFR